MSAIHTPAHRRWIFLVFLAALHLVFVFGPESLAGRWLFVSHIGLGLIWQPFVQPRRHLGPVAAGVVILIAGGLAYFLGWGILLGWTMLLAGIVGGKVFVFPDRWERLFHLTALGYLVVAVLALILPAVLPSLNFAEPVLANLAIYLAPPVFLFMAVLPIQQGFLEERAEIVDFVYGVFVVLLLAVIVLGSLAYVLVFKAGYFEAQLVTLASVAGVLFLLGLIWNPRAGFGGVGVAVAQHVMSLGLPVEEWLQSLADLGRREEDPERFLSLACNELPRRLPGVTGGRWEADGTEGTFGTREGVASMYEYGRLKLELRTRIEPSPSLRWHHDLVVRLLAEFHLGKWRARELQRLSYIEAIHETGARLTHDVKNLLQSLDTLCAAASETTNTSAPRFGDLLRRQLPEISARLRQTLDKLAKPAVGASSEAMPAGEWLAALGRRYEDGNTVVLAEGNLANCRLVDAALFSSVAENLLQNIVIKRRSEPDIRAKVRLLCKEDGAVQLEVSDDGTAIPAALASRLFEQRVPSESGFGIGLYQCARQAEQAGYRLVLDENRAGCVRFSLLPRAVDPRP